MERRGENGLQGHGAGPIPGSRKRFVVRIDRAAGLGDAAVQQTKIEELGLAGLGEVTDIRLSHANGCRHILHTGAEVGAISVYGTVLCSECARNIGRCARCGFLFFEHDLRLAKRAGEELAFCPQCWPWRFLLRWQDWARIVAAGLIVFVLLLSLGTC